MTQELWRPVPYEPYGAVYSVSNLGRVKPNAPSRYSKNGTEVLKPSPSPRGYLHVSLYVAGKCRSCFIHRMVAIAFHGPPPFEGAIVCHKNDVQTDNRADNLEWGTQKSNAATREAIGKTTRGIGNGRALLTEDDVRAIRARYAAGTISQTALAHEYGIKCQSTISAIILRKLWPHIT